MEMTLRVEIFPDDLDAIVDFYTKVLGFTLTTDRRTEPSAYVSLERDSVRVGAARRPATEALAARRPPTGAELVLEVDDVTGERDRVAAAGWPLDEDLLDRPWGLTDFRIVDPAGYYLRITGRAGPQGIAFGDLHGDTTAMPWLPADFIHPLRVAVGDGHHLRPITAADTDLDYPAVMGSQPRLWSIFGPAWAWPPTSMTYQEDRDDLARHEAEIAAHQSFNYALFDDAETALLGCVYIDPPEKQGADAEISWWVVDAMVGTEVQRALDTLVPRWIASDWPFTQPRYIGSDLSWADWLALPDV